MVSAGWRRDKIVHYRGRESAFRAQLVIRYADGSEKRFGTDASWRGVIASPVKRQSRRERVKETRRRPACRLRRNRDVRQAWTL